MEISVIVIKTVTVYTRKSIILLKLPLPPCAKALKLLLQGCSTLSSPQYGSVRCKEASPVHRVDFPDTGRRERKRNARVTPSLPCVETVRYRSHVSNDRSPEGRGDSNPVPRQCGTRGAKAEAPMLQFAEQLAMAAGQAFATQGKASEESVEDHDACRHGDRRQGHPAGHVSLRCGAPSLSSPRLQRVAIRAHLLIRLSLQAT